MLGRRGHRSLSPVCPVCRRLSGRAGTNAALPLDFPTCAGDGASARHFPQVFAFRSGDYEGQSKRFTSFWFSSSRWVMYGIICISLCFPCARFFPRLCHVCQSVSRSPASYQLQHSSLCNMRCLSVLSEVQINHSFQATGCFTTAFQLLLDSSAPSTPSAQMDR